MIKIDGLVRVMWIARLVWIGRLIQTSMSRLVQINIAVGVVVGAGGPSKGILDCVGGSCGHVGGPRCHATSKAGRPEHGSLAHVGRSLCHVLRMRSGLRFLWSKEIKLIDFSYRELKWKKMLREIVPPVGSSGSRFDLASYLSSTRMKLRD